MTRPRSGFSRKAWVVALAAILPFSLDPSAQAKRRCSLLYEDNFQSAPMTWLTVPAKWADDGTEVNYPPPEPMVREEERGNYFLSSTGPWWFDRNFQLLDPAEEKHSNSVAATGAVHLLAVIYSGMWGVYGAPQKPANRVVLPSGQSVYVAPRFDLKLAQRLIPKGDPGDLLATGPIHGANSLTAIDLRNARLRFRLRTHHVVLPKGAHIQFWFQTYDEDAKGGARMVNYLYRPYLEPILRDGTWKTVDITLDTNNRDWQCLGSNYLRTDTYGCSRSVAAALKTFNTDMGLLMFLGNSFPDRAVGKIDFDEVEVRVCS
jgi:hypothetical protein